MLNPKRDIIILVVFLTDRLEEVLVIIFQKFSFLVEELNTMDSKSMTSPTTTLLFVVQELDDWRLPIILPVTEPHQDKAPPKLFKEFRDLGYAAVP